MARMPVLQHSTDCTLRMRCRGEYAEGCELCETVMDYQMATAVPPEERTPHQNWAVAWLEQSAERDHIMRGNLRGAYVRIRD